MLSTKVETANSSLLWCRYGLVKSRGSLDREISGIYQSEAPTTFDELTPVSERLHGGFNNSFHHKDELAGRLFYDLTQR